MTAGIAAVAPEVPVREVPVADGGDGTVDAALAAGFERVEVRAEGPTGKPVDTAFALRDGVAVVEMADVSGLRLLPAGRARRAGGQLVRHRRGRSPPRWSTGCHTVRARHRRQRQHRRRGRHAGRARAPGCSTPTGPSWPAAGRRWPGWPGWSWTGLHPSWRRPP